MRWTWELSHRAEKDLARIEKPVRSRIFDALDRMTGELSTGVGLSNVKRLASIEPEEWRLRVGDYRVRFQMKIRPGKIGHEQGNIEFSSVVVVKVAHRREAYR